MTPRSLLGRASLLAGGAALVTGCSFLLGDDYTSGDESPDASGDAPFNAPDVTTLEAAAPVDAAPPSLRPAEGRYVYTAKGFDQISVGPITTNFGATASATVTHTANECFDLDMVYRNRYTESLSYCIRNGSAVVHQASKRRQFFQILAGLEVRTTITCAPGDVYLTRSPTATDVATHLCSGNNDDDQYGNSVFQTGGPYTFAGQENVAVAGVEVPAYHFHETLKVTGSQTGTNTREWYFAVKGSELVKLTGKVSILFVMVGVNYGEDFELVLSSLTPTPVDAGTDAPSGG